MNIKRVILNISLMGATLSCPFLYASCHFRMKELNYFYGKNSLFKVNLKMGNVCAEDPLRKREIKNIELNIFKKNSKIVTLQFDEGLWMPGQSRFLLKKKGPFLEGCFKGFKNIQVNLKNNYINSLDGLYLNLEDGKRMKLNCFAFQK